MPVRRAEWRVRSKPISRLVYRAGGFAGVVHHPDVLRSVIRALGQCHGCPVGRLRHLEVVHSVIAEQIVTTTTSALSRARDMNDAMRKRPGDPWGGPVWGDTRKTRCFS